MGVGVGFAQWPPGHFFDGHLAIFAVTLLLLFGYSYSSQFLAHRHNHRFRKDQNDAPHGPPPLLVK